MSGIADAPALALLSGPQSGTRIPLDAELLIGSDPRCRLNVPTASPIQATVRLEGLSYVLHDGGGPDGVWVNDDRVHGSAPLRDGDIIWIGPPGGPTSLMIQCKLRGAAPAVAPPPASVDADSDFIMDEPIVPAAAPAPPPIVIDEFVVDPVVEPPPPADAEVFFVSDSPSFIAAAAPPPPPPPMEDEAFFVADEPAPSWQPPSEPAAFIPPPPPVPAPAPPPPAPPPTTERPTVVQTPAPPPPAPPAPAPPSPPPAAPPRPREVKTIAQGVPGTPGAEGARPVAAPPSRPRDAAPRPPATPTRSARSSSAPTPIRSGGGSARRPSSRVPAGYVFAAAATVVVVALVAGIANHLLRAPVLLAVSPTRARLGEAVMITGKNFSASAAQNQVLFGDMEGKVLESSPTELKVEVPTMRILAGEDTPLSVKVRVSGRATGAVSLTVFDAPRIARVTPDVAMPGETIEIEGVGWSAQSASVRIGDAAAEIQGSGANRLTVRVPALDAALGTTLNVVVTSSGAPSAPVSLLIGRLPLITEIAPVRAIAGDVVQVKGRGFSPEASADQVRIGGVPALVFAASATELSLVMPRVAVSADTPSPLTVLVTGRPQPAEGRLTLAPGPDPVDFRFVAEPFVDAAGHEHAIVATELGPVFVLSASGAKTAAERAAEAAKAWNDAAVRLKASLDEDVELRGAENGNPVLALRGRSVVLVEATDEDAAGYNEGWVKGAGPAVNKARLAAWWDALTRDLVLMLIRGRKPERTPALAAEGKLLVQLQEKGQKTGRFGLPREVLNGMKPAEIELLRTFALRVPATVGPAAGSAAASAELAGPKLDGVWMGSETESDRKRPITVTFNGRRGTLAYSGGVAIEIPVHDVELQKGSVRFNAEIRGGTRYYVGRWDGQKISGTINQEGGDAHTPLGTFELSQ